MMKINIFYWKKYIKLSTSFDKRGEIVYTYNDLTVFMSYHVGF